MFGMMGVFAEFERAMIQERVKAGLARVRDEGVTLGRPTLEDADPTRAAKVRAMRARGVGVHVLTSRGDDLTDSDDEMRVAMRQIAGVFAQLEKTRLVKKLAGARRRKRKTGAKVEGRPSFAQLAIGYTKASGVRVEGDPELLAAIKLAKRLRRAGPRTGERRSL